MRFSYAHTLSASLLVGQAIAAPFIDELRPLEPRQIAGDTRNDLMNGPCKGTTVVFARGTTETGNVGTLAGPPFFDAMSKSLNGDLAVQGVDYPADIPGFLAGGDKGGSQKMAQLVQQAMTKCPNTKVVMCGYSQGGQLVHNAAAMLPASVSAQVSKAVIFGDPDNGKAVQGVSATNTKVICHQGDLICAGQSVILAPHLTYSQDAGTAASFVAGGK